MSYCKSKLLYIYTEPKQNERCQYEDAGRVLRSLPGHARHTIQAWRAEEDTCAKRFADMPWSSSWNRLVQKKEIKMVFFPRTRLTFMGNFEGCG